jgi:hypothetical protein
MTYYKQAKLQKLAEQQVAWIPESLAHRGSELKIKSDDGTWDNGWIVVEVGARQPEKYVLNHERDYRTSRNATDAVRDSDGIWDKVR